MRPDPSDAFGSDSHGPRPTAAAAATSLSLKTILGSLVMSEYTLSFVDLLRYGMISTVVLYAALYFFPAQLLMIAAMMLLIAFAIVYIAIQKTYNATSSRPIDGEKLRKYRNVRSVGRTVRDGAD